MQVTGGPQSLHCTGAAIVVPREQHTHTCTYMNARLYHSMIADSPAGYRPTAEVGARRIKSDLRPVILPILSETVMHKPVSAP